MPLTVITLKNVPPALRGDLTKWMQEIATGVYVGNFNARIREALWERVCKSAGTGEATMSYTARNEIGYQFQTSNTRRQNIDYDGIPLVMIPGTSAEEESKLSNGFSNASKFKRARRYAGRQKMEERDTNHFVALDIETTGLDETSDEIIEVGAVKFNNGELQYFQRFISCEREIPDKIVQLTGITTLMIRQQGLPLKNVLSKLMDFIGDDDIVGYNIGFDIRFLNSKLQQLSLPMIHNRSLDLLKTVKQEKMFQTNYKLQTTLKAYGIDEPVKHRALEDAILVYKLSQKVKKFR
ncbi:MAG: type I-E CRISPR-associated endoribonuclease Cas2e [Anaerovoracaceae bacterium]|jgi:CRISPR-associated protein Cas2